MDPLKSATAMPLEPGPLAYLLTFSTYGTWLHGDPRGSHDRDHNRPGDPPMPPNEKLRTWEREHLKYPPMQFDAERRRVVLDALKELIERRGWLLIAINVRECHVHTELNPAKDPKSMIGDLKAWATHRLIEAGLAKEETRVWTRGGSYRSLWTPEEVARAASYVVEGQGSELGVFGDVPGIFF